MLCENCGKNPAQTFIRKINGREIAIELCPSCYRALYPEKQADRFAAFFGGERQEDKACPACGTTAAQFRQTGLVGCSYCYLAMRAELMETVRNLQGIKGEVRHTGKRPDAAAEERYDSARDYAARQEGLIEELENAMRAGDYARASALQRALKELKMRPNGGDS